MQHARKRRPWANYRHISTMFAYAPDAADECSETCPIHEPHATEVEHQPGRGGEVGNYLTKLAHTERV
jgi:hypothetical protein